MAEKFGQGATGKAISTRFERVKKESSWDLSINRELDGGSTSKTSTPRKRTPKAKKAASSNEDEDDEEGNYEDTPSKKTPLHKVKGGRIQKNGNGRGRKAINYAEADEDVEEIKGEIVEDEHEVEMHENEHDNDLANGYGNDENGGYYPVETVYYDEEEEV